MRGYVHLYGVPGIPQSTHSLTYQCTKYKRMRWHVRESCNEWLSLSIMGIPARTPINHTGMLWDVSPHNRIIRSIWKISTRYSAVTCVKWVDKILSGQNVHHQHAWVFYSYIHTTWCDYLRSISNVYTTSIIVVLLMLLRSFRWVVGGEACRSGGEFRPNSQRQRIRRGNRSAINIYIACLLYTSPSPRD